MRLSELAFGIILAFLAGIFFASFVFSSALLILLLLALGLALTSVFWTRAKGRHAGLLLLACAFGMAHYSQAASLPEPLKEPKEVSFVARVVQVQQDEQGAKAVVESEAVSGRILLFTSRFEELRVGDRVALSGKLTSPAFLEDFDYPLFLAKDKIFFVMFAPEIKVHERSRPLIAFLRGSLQEKIDASFPQPESSLLSAMLLGNKAGLPEDFAEKLNATGTRHITAVSGMHVAILSGMLFAVLLNLRLARKKSSLLVLAFLVFFVAFTGFAASAVRAGIMASTFLLAGLLGRRNVSLRILVFAAGGMLFANPLLLAHDIGFQLSFLAVFGILLFLPLLQHWFRRVGNPFGVRDAALMSVAAQVFTLPLVLHHFGMVSAVSLAANLLVVPLLPLALLLGVFFLAFSMPLPFLADLFALPAGLLFSTIAFVVEKFSQVPFAASHLPQFSFWLLLPFYLAAYIFARRFEQQRRFQFREERMLGWM